MKKYGLYLMMVATALFCSTSCGDEEEDNHLERWMVVNQQAFNAIKTNPEYKELKSLGNEGSIYYKVLEEGNGTDSIYYTSRIECYYKGWFVANYPELYFENGQIFDQTLYNDGTPYNILPGFVTPDGVYKVINGWKTVLQHMKKGDKWEVWVPYQLGYGREGSINNITKKVLIPGYSTLVFEIEVVSVMGIDGK